MKNKNIISVFFSIFLLHEVCPAGSSTDLPGTPSTTRVISDEKQIEIRTLDGQKIDCDEKDGNYHVNYFGRRLIFPVDSVNHSIVSHILLKEGMNFYRLELIKNPDNTASIVKYRHPFRYNPRQYNNRRQRDRDPTEEEIRFYLELLKNRFIVLKDFYCTQEGYHSMQPFHEFIQCFEGLRNMLTTSRQEPPYDLSKDPNFTNFLNFCNYYIKNNLINIIDLVKEYIDYIPALCTSIGRLEIVILIFKPL
jgi:hypothetical protein